MKGDYDRSTVISHLEAVQLDATGNECVVTKSIEQIDLIHILNHHYNIPYELNSVPVSTLCGGSRKFIVRVFMKWNSGNSVKIDGSRADESGREAFTNAVAYNV
jgi:hypothetical protein